MAERQKRPNVAERRKQFEDLVARAETLISDLEGAQSNAVSAADALSAAEVHRDRAAELVQNLENSSAAASGLAKEAESAEGRAFLSAESAAASAKTASDAHEELVSTSEKINEIKSRADAALSGATSVGLAKAFRERREQLAPAENFWRWAVLGGLLLTGAAAIFGPQLAMLGEEAEVPWWGRHIMRIPLAAPFLLLAGYAAIRHGNYLRLAEEYAYKESLSHSFEGYKEQLEAMREGEPGDTPIYRLVEQTLEAISRPPSVVFDSKNRDGLPTVPVTRRRDNESTELLDEGE